jgi:hypothetical protein
VVEERAGTPTEARSQTEQLWVPDGLPKGVVPEASDAYVVIDDLADGVAVLAAAPWPHLDRAGRLVFESSAVDSPPHFGRTDDSVQERVDELRSGQAEPSVTTRPLRIGDVFLVRGFSTRLDEWQLLVDVTPQARTAAKIALFGAIAPRVSQDRVAELGLDPSAPPPPVPPSRPRGAPKGGAAPAV